MPQNILFTSWYTGLGGGETDLLSIAAFLDPHEWTPHLLLPSDGILTDKWRDYGWQVHIVKYRGASTYFVPFIWEKLPIVNRITEIIATHQIDLIASEYHTLPMAYPAANKMNIPIMWTVHGWWFKPKFWQRSFFADIPIVARSQSIRDGYLGDPPFMPPSQVPVIYSGVDTHRFRPNSELATHERTQLGFSEDTPLVAMVARFQSVKGHHTFQAMVEKVVQAIPDAQFVVAGEDTFGIAKDEAYRQTMLNNATTNPILKTHLQYLGFRHDVESILTAADVVVCASDFESYGKVNLEAMACGTPVVSTNQGGPAETIIDGETGYLVPPSHPQALAERVIHLLNHPDDRQRIGLAARQHILDRFSAKTAANHYHQFFRTLLTPPL
ncbi:MAG: glycosyltransferase family 4 protein [Phototrophicaceae bacterium]